MADAFNKEAFTLLGVGTLIIGVRMYARFKTAKSIHNLAADDYLMLLAAVSENHSRDREGFSLHICITGDLRIGNRMCILCGRSLYGASEQQHDTTTKGRIVPSFEGIPIKSGRVEIAAYGMVVIYPIALDIENLCLHILFAHDVSSAAFRFLTLEAFSSFKILTKLLPTVLVLHT